MTNKVKMAYDFASVRHSGQKRKQTDIDYIRHLEDTSRLLWEVDNEADQDTIVAALLHDVVEDTPTTLDEVGSIFGDYVMKLVKELTCTEEERAGRKKVDYLADKINNMSDTAFTIKLCDRLSNVLDLKNKEIPTGFVVWYWKETRNLMSKITRDLSSAQESLIDTINSTLAYLKLSRNFKEE